MDKSRLRARVKWDDYFALDMANNESWEYLEAINMMHRLLDKSESQTDIIEGLFQWYLQHRRRGCRGGVPAWVPGACRALMKKVEAWQRQAEPGTGASLGSVLG